MKSFYRFTMVFFFAVAGLAHATFSSLYIFGDGTSATTNSFLSANYYGGTRYSNGRTWVEVLAQRQGLGASSLTSTNWSYSTNNRSFYGHYSFLLVTNVNNFVAPANATNALFIVWVANADFVEDVGNLGGGIPGNLAAWTNSINQHLTNHFRALTNLYAKGMRTLVAPNAVDLTKVPQYTSYTPAGRAFIRQRIVEFNIAYSNRLNQIKAISPGLTIYSPDVFSLLDEVESNAIQYGLTNVLDDTTNVISAQQNLLPAQAAVLNGPGTNYIWWGPIAPSARFHAVIADTAQQLISPVSAGGLISVNTSNQLPIVNAPVGMNGIVLFATNLDQTVWLTNSTFSTLTVTQSVFVNPTNSQRFYRLKFPWQWTWP